MAEWYVSTDTLRECSAGIAQCGTAVKNASTAVHNIARGISCESVSMVMCHAKLNLLMRDMRTEAMQVEYMAQTMETISGRYQAAEKGLLDPQLKQQSFAVSSAGNSGTISSWAVDPITDTGAEDTKTDEPLWKKALDAGVKVIGASLGPIGLIGETVYSIIQGKDVAQNVVKNLFKLCGKEVKPASKGSDASWKEWVFGDLLKRKDADDILDGTLNKYNVFAKSEGAVDWTARIGSTCLLIATFVGQGFQNYDEQGEFNARWAEETVVETALTVGKDVLAGAIVSALVAGAGAVATVATGATVTISLPAVAVVGATALAGLALDWAGNAIAKKVTGDDKATWLECISDLVCDKVIEPVADVVKNAAGNVVDAVKQGARWIGDGIGNATQNLFGSSCAWAIPA